MAVNIEEQFPDQGDLSGLDQDALTDYIRAQEELRGRGVFLFTPGPRTAKRTRQDQQDLVNEGYFAAAPGTSDHEKGFALDLNVRGRTTDINDPEVQAVLSRYRFTRPLADRDPVHHVYSKRSQAAGEVLPDLTSDVTQELLGAGGASGGGLPDLTDQISIELRPKSAGAPFLPQIEGTHGAPLAGPGQQATIPTNARDLKGAIDLTADQIGREAVELKRIAGEIAKGNEILANRPLEFNEERLRLFTEKVADYNARIGLHQQRVRDHQQYRSAYAALPAGTIPKIAPETYQPPNTDRQLLDVETLIKTLPAHTDEPTRKKYDTQRQKAYLALGQSLPRRRDQLLAKKTRLEQQGLALAHLREQAEKGELSPATIRALGQAIKTWRINAGVLDWESQFHNEAVSRFGKWARANQGKPVHSGIDYPEEYERAAKAEKGRDQSLVGRALAFFGGAASAEGERRLARILSQMQITGEYPPLPQLPEGLSPAEREDRYRKKNEVVLLLTHEANIARKGISNEGLRPVTAGEVEARLARLTPFQQSLLPTLRKQSQAIATAVQESGLPRLKEADRLIGFLGTVAAIATSGATSAGLARTLPAGVRALLNGPIFGAGATAALERLAVRAGVGAVSGAAAGAAGSGLAGGTTAAYLGADLPTTLSVAGQSALKGAEINAPLGAASAIIGGLRRPGGPARPGAGGQPGAPPPVGPDQTPGVPGLSIPDAPVRFTDPRTGFTLEVLEQYRGGNALVKVVGAPPGAEAAIGSQTIVTGSTLRSYAPTATPGSPGQVPPKTPTALKEPPAAEIPDGPVISSPSGAPYGLRLLTPAQVVDLGNQFGQAGSDPATAAEAARLAKFAADVQAFNAQRGNPPLPITAPEIQDAWKQGSPARALYDTLRREAERQRDKNPDLTAKLDQAAADLQREVIFLAGANASGLDQGQILPPPSASPYRQLSEAELAALSPRAREALLLQDINNSRQVLDTGASLVFSPRDVEGGRRALQSAADTQFIQANRAAAAIYPDVQQVAPTPPTAQPAPTPQPAPTEPPTAPVGVSAEPIGPSEPTPPSLPSQPFSGQVRAEPATELPGPRFEQPTLSPEVVKAALALEGQNVVSVKALGSILGLSANRTQTVLQNLRSAGAVRVYSESGGVPTRYITVPTNLNRLLEGVRQREVGRNAQRQEEVLERHRPAEDETHNRLVDRVAAWLTDRGPKTTEQIARQFGVPESQAQAIVAELQELGILARRGARADQPVRLRVERLEDLPAALEEARRNRAFNRLTETTPYESYDDEPEAEAPPAAEPEPKPRPAPTEPPPPEPVAEEAEEAEEAEPEAEERPAGGGIGRPTRRQPETEAAPAAEEAALPIAQVIDLHPGAVLRHPTTRQEIELRDRREHRTGAVIWEAVITRPTPGSDERINQEVKHRASALAGTWELVQAAGDVSTRPLTSVDLKPGITIRRRGTDVDFTVLRQEGDNWILRLIGGSSNERPYSETRLLQQFDLVLTNLGRRRQAEPEAEPDWMGMPALRLAARQDMKPGAVIRKTTDSVLKSVVRVTKYDPKSGNHKGDVLARSVRSFSQNPTEVLFLGDFDHGKWELLVEGEGAGPRPGPEPAPAEGQQPALTREDVLPEATYRMRGIPARMVWQVDMVDEDGWTAHLIEGAIDDANAKKEWNETWEALELFTLVSPGVREAAPEPEDDRPASKTLVWEEIEPDVREAVLMRALLNTENAEERWAERRVRGLTDEELVDAIGREFGIQGSSTHPRPGNQHKGGKNPRFWMPWDTDVGTKPTLGGARLRDVVRELLRIPRPEEVVVEPEPEPRRQPRPQTSEQGGLTEDDLEEGLIVRGQDGTIWRLLDPEYWNTIDNTEPGWNIEVVAPGRQGRRMRGEAVWESTPNLTDPNQYVRSDDPTLYDSDIKQGARLQHEPSGELVLVLSVNNKARTAEIETLRIPNPDGIQVGDRREIDFETLFEGDWIKATPEPAGGLADLLEERSAETEPTGRPAGAPLDEAPETEAAPAETAPTAPTAAYPNLKPGQYELVLAMVDEIDAAMRSDAPTIWADNPALERYAQRFLGGSRAAGTYSVDTVYESLEAAVNKWIVNYAGLGLDSERQALDKLKKLTDKLPTQNIRTDERVEMQQFSTPPRLAYLTAFSLDQRWQGYDILEPSVGTGSLVAAVQSYLGQNAKFTYHLNELDLSRRDLAALVLADQGPELYSVNAEFLHSTLPGPVRPDAIVMNPPFSATGGRVSRHDNEFGFRHLREALKRLRPNGRLVAIMGQGAALDRPGAREFWSEMMGLYDVRVNVGLPGAEYYKYGTSFPNQIIVIDKTGPTPGASLTDRRANVWSGEVPDLESYVDQFRTRHLYAQRQQTEGQPDRPETGAGPDVGAGQGGPGRQPTAPSGGRVGGRQPSGLGSGPDLAERPGDTGPGAVDRGSAGDTAPEGTTPAPDAGKQPVGPLREDTPAGPVTPPPPPTETLVGDEEGSVFTHYQAPTGVPGNPHPGRMVETRSLAAVDGPALTYQLQVPKMAEAIAAGRISALQLHAAMLAGQRHDLLLPSGARAGILIGDGTGSGKTRELVAISADNFERGRRKQLWVSVSADLATDIRNEFKALGYEHIPVKLINDWAAGDDIDPEFEGVVFTTYDSLGSKAQKGSNEGRQRVEQIKLWMGEEGVVFYDESHRLKNATQQGRSEPSKRALLAIQLQEDKPAWRFTYASATGATTLDNLGYMSRLGLWGPETPFPNFAEFQVEMAGGGVLLMEQVARDLKAVGAYVAREISFEGTEYDPLTAPLTADQRHAYELSARVWQLALQHFDQAAVTTSMDSRAKGVAASRFWNTHQRFFRQLLTAMKVPAIIQDVRKELAKNHSVVISLIGTGEATENRKVRDAIDQGMSLDEIDFSPVEILMDLIDKHYPTTQYVEQEVPGSNPPVIQLVPLVDADGHPIENREAVEARDRLKEEVATTLGNRLPGNPLDEILFGLGHNNVAELSGRDKRREYGEDGVSVVRVSRKSKEMRGKTANRVEMERFQDGRKRVAVITKAASTGYSLHASLRAKNQQRRIHYVAELAWSADETMQGFGRTHRSEQASAPVYKLVFTDAGGEARFAATIARRLAALGAITRGERQATGGGNLSQYDFENEFGINALTATIRELTYGGEIEGIGNGRQLLRDIGLWKRHSDGTEGVSDEDARNVPRFLNRLLALEIDRQNALYDMFFTEFTNQIENARLGGWLDVGLQDIEGRNVRLAEAPQLVYTHPTYGTQTHYAKVLTEVPVYPVTTKEIQDLPAESQRGYYRRKSDQSIAYARELPSRFDVNTGNAVQNYRMLTPTNANPAPITGADLISRYDRIPDNEQIAAIKEWDEAVEAAPRTRTRTHHLVSGAVLFLWDRLQSARQATFRPMRAKLDSGERLLGIEINQGSIRTVLRALGAAAGTTTPAEIAERVLEGGERIRLVGGVSLVRRRMAGTSVIEVDGIEWSQGEDLVARRGFLSERDAQYRRHIWVPADATRDDKIAYLINRWPPMDGGTAVNESRILPWLKGKDEPFAFDPRPQSGQFEQRPYQQIDWAMWNERRLKSGLAIQGSATVSPETYAYLDSLGPAFREAFWSLLSGALPPEEYLNFTEYGYLVENDRQVLGRNYMDDREGEAVFINPFPPAVIPVEVTDTMASWMRPSRRQPVGTMVLSLDRKYGEEEEDPHTIATVIVQTMIHEIAHHYTRSEVEPLWQKINELEEKITRPTMMRAIATLARAISHGKGKEYGLSRRYRKARADYLEAVWRATGDGEDHDGPDTTGAGPGSGVSERRILRRPQGGAAPNRRPRPTRGDLGNREGDPTPPRELTKVWQATLDNQVTPQEGVVDWAKRWARQLTTEFWRDYPHLDRREYAQLRHFLNRTAKKHGTARLQAHMHLARTTEGLTPADRNMYGFAIVVLDLSEEVQRQRLRIKEKKPHWNAGAVDAAVALPRGRTSTGEFYQWTPQMVARAYEWVSIELNRPENAAIANAIKLRRATIAAIKEPYLDAMQRALGQRRELDREDYFHHELLYYQEANRQGLGGLAGERVMAKGYLRQREGSTLEYLTDPIAADTAWMAPMIFDTLVLEVLEYIQTYDVSDDLKRIALAINNQAVMEFFQKVADLENSRAVSGDKEPLTARDIYRRELNRKLAHGFHEMGRMAYNGILPDGNGRWQDLINEIGERWAMAMAAKEEDEDPVFPEGTDEEEAEFYRQLFQYAAFVLGEHGGQPGSGAAALIFKGVAEKRDKIKQILGKEELGPEDIVKLGRLEQQGKLYDPEGVLRPLGLWRFADIVDWQPQKGNLFYHVNTLDERLAEEVLEDGDPGMPRIKAALRRALVLGGKRRTLFIPAPIARTLADIGQTHGVIHPLDALLDAPDTAWRTWILMQPARFLTYYRNNWLGDQEAILAFNPAAYLQWGEAKAALKELFDYKQAPDPATRADLLEWIDMGGLWSTFQAAVGRFQDQPLNLMAHMARPDDRSAIRRTWSAYWRTVEGMNDQREAVGRFATYLAWKRELEGKLRPGMSEQEVKPANYGASIKEEVDALATIAQKSWTLSNDAILAYDTTSHGMKRIREKAFRMPFWTFDEGNVRRWFNGYLNAWRTSQRLGELSDEIIVEYGLELAIGGGGIKEPPKPPPPPPGSGPGNAEYDDWLERQRIYNTAKQRIARYKRDRAAFRRLLGTRLLRRGTILYIMGRVGVFALKSQLFLWTLEAWNRSPWVRKHDDALPIWVRARQGHLTIPGGGNTVYSLSRLSSLEQVADWFGMDDPMGYHRAVIDGQLSVKEAALLYGTSLVNNVVQQAGPIKTVIELLVGQKAYPNVLEPRQIRDRWEHLADSLALGGLYRRARGLPQAQGHSLLDVIGVKAYDVRELAYQESYGDARLWQTAVLGQGGDTSGGSSRTAMLYQAKRALKAGQPGVAASYVSMYLSAGGTRRGVQASLMRMDPLFGFDERETKLYLKGGRSPSGKIVPGLDQLAQVKLRSAYRYLLSTSGVPVREGWEKMSLARFVERARQAYRESVAERAGELVDQAKEKRPELEEVP